MVSRSSRTSTGVILCSRLQIPFAARHLHKKLRLVQTELAALKRTVTSQLIRDGVLSLFFNDTATTEIYTLSLHDALPIYPIALAHEAQEQVLGAHGIVLEALGLFVRQAQHPAGALGKLLEPVAIPVGLGPRDHRGSMATNPPPEPPQSLRRRAVVVHCSPPGNIPWPPKRKRLRR